MDGIEEGEFETEDIDDNNYVDDEDDDYGEEDRDYSTSDSDQESHVKKTDAKKNRSNSFNNLVELDSQGYEKNVECSVCGKRFSQLVHLTNHMRTHTGEKPFQCSVCQKAFGHYANLTTHMRLHTGEKPYTCEVCHQSFTHANTLKMHKRIHTGERPYRCTVCDDHFSRNDQLKRHMSIHTGVKPYNCQICTRSFTQIDSLKMHMEKHTDVKPFECGVCHKKFASVVTLKRHMRNHEEKTFQCDRCENKYIFKAELKRHIASQHSTERPYKCSICEKTFAVSSNLTNHMVVHTGEKPYQCPYCEKRFTSHSNMCAHKRLEHTKERLHPCLQCDRMFPRPADLKKHMVSHSGEKKYICSVCSKAFPATRNLKVHMRTHTGEKPFSCPVCQKAFMHRPTMQRHVKIHYDITLLTTGQVDPLSGLAGMEKTRNGKAKRYLQCPFCLKEFFYFKHFRSHMTLHPETTSLAQSEEKCHPSIAECASTVSCDASQECNSNAEDTLVVKMEPGDHENQLDDSDLALTSATVTNAGDDTADGLVMDLSSQSILSRNEKLSIICESVGNSPIFKCPVCHLKSENKQFLLIHMKLHTDSQSSIKHNFKRMKLKPFKCSTCSKAFVLLKTLRKHMKKHQLQQLPKKSSLPTSVVQKQQPKPEIVESSSVTERKKRKKTRGPPVTCTVCDKIFIYAKSMNKHMEEHSKDKTFDDHLPQKVLAVANKSVKSRSEQDPVDIKPFICLVCSKHFDDISALKNHENTHKASQPAMFPCSQCGQHFTDIDSLNIHEADHRKDVDVKDVDVKPLLCPECGEVFQTANALRNHQAEVHAPDLQSLNLFPCFECGERFGDAASLRTHEGLHKAKPSERLCSKRGEIFDDSDSLKLHVEQDNNRPIVKFCCSTCDEEFDGSDIDLFKDHLITHNQAILNQLNLQT